jgi:GntR family transcriptional regulator/MocR family aminotransferase
VTVAEHARRAAIPAWSLSLHTDENRQPPALLLGFAGNRAQDLGPATRRLGHIIRMLEKSAGTETPED